MKKIRCDGWQDGTDKDTFWNMAVLIVGILIAIASAIDPSGDSPSRVAHAERGYVTAVR